VKTRILITIGDINGIGPEIILKTLRIPSIAREYDITVLSPLNVLEYYSKLTGIKLNPENFGIISIRSESVRIQPGKISKDAGRIAGIAIESAVWLCMRKEFDAIVTAPISKNALNLGGFNYSGHTEMLTSLAKAKDSCMVMVSDELNMGFASTHPPLRKAA